MSSLLEQDLIADGFTPSYIGLKGVVEWTGWSAPPEDDRLGAETTPTRLRDVLRPHHLGHVRPDG